MKVTCEPKGAPVERATAEPGSATWTTHCWSSRYAFPIVALAGVRLRGGSTSCRGTLTGEERRIEMSDVACASAGTLDDLMRHAVQMVMYQAVFDRR
jgi:hypothetical protein